MKLPKRVNYNLAIYLIGLSDLIIGILIFFYIKNWLPDIEIIIPKFFYKAKHTPYSVELIIFTLFWFIQMGMSGLYRQLKQKEFIQYYSLFVIVLFIGHVFFTFLFFTKNEILFEYGFYHFFFQLYLIILLAYSIPRLLFYLILYIGMKRQWLATYAIMIGNSSKAESVLSELSGLHKITNYHFIGYIETSNIANGMFHLPMNKLGSIDQLQNIIESFAIDEVIVAIENGDSYNTQKVLNIVKQKDITIKLVPDLNAILEGNVKLNNVEGVPLITIRNNLMPVWQIVLKVTFDYAMSILALAITAPIIPFVLIGILTSSKGSIFYTQIRIGKNKKPFKMIKFRSMYSNSEQSGPALASSSDPRITPFGKVMRKWHIDELPQFINVLKGDMSIVGPRPERLHFIEQITQIAPHYTHVFRIKPGITSWGMVKYGYAENVDQMIERLKYDILYLENMSFLVDLKIILHTLRSVLIGDGK
jgi:exopolysaccharide biosynthesis polyprenyl glycosylphosphotransferase